jgi:ABC-type molybdate transport system ATPase subunit
MVVNSNDISNKTRDEIHNQTQLATPNTTISVPALNQTISSSVNSTISTSQLTIAKNETEKLSVKGHEMD